MTEAWSRRVFGGAMGADFETIQEIVQRAYQEMSPHVREHVNGGSESETTLLRNRQSIAAEIKAKLLN